MSNTKQNTIKNILFYDHNWSVQLRIVSKFANLVRESGVHVILLSDRMISQTNENLEIVNIFDVPQKKTLDELHKNYSFSLHKALVPERAFYDYSSFRRSQCYSKLSEEEIKNIITPYVNAVDYMMRERADIVIEAFPDNFVTSILQMLATEYGKRIFVPFAQYWWKDGALIIDRMNMTSTVIDGNYELLYKNPELVDADLISRVFAKPLTAAFTTTKRMKMYTLRDRIQLFINRQKGYQPISSLNWIVRRVSTFISSVLIKTLISREFQIRDEKYVIYPLHISPEAALLGTNPELADQFGLIKNISMNLPYGVKLYVKQHPYEHLGLGLDYGFYRRLATLPNVRIVDASVKLASLLDNKNFIALTILAGTSALDAALKRKPVIVFGTTYYSIADCFIKPKDFQDFFIQIKNIMEGEFVFNERGLNALLGALEKSVVRAKIDLLAHDNQTDQVFEYPLIWQSYVESCKIG
jgi:hypothetical protein